jgi:hypothetical protein
MTTQLDSRVTWASQRLCRRMPARLLSIVAPVQVVLPALFNCRPCGSAASQSHPTHLSLSLRHLPPRAPPCNLVATTWCTRFLFFTSVSGRIMGGSQETLEFLGADGDVDMTEVDIPVENFIPDHGMAALMASAEAAYSKGGQQSAKPVKVSPAICSKTACVSSV